MSASTVVLVVVESSIVVATDPAAVWSSASASASASSGGSAARSEPIIGTIAANPAIAATVTAHLERRAGCVLRRTRRVVTATFAAGSGSRISSGSGATSGGIDSTSHPASGAASDEPAGVTPEGVVAPSIWSVGGAKGAGIAETDDAATAPEGAAGGCHDATAACPRKRRRRAMRSRRDCSV